MIFQRQYLYHLRCYPKLHVYTHFVKSCKATLKSNASPRSWNPIPMKAWRPKQIAIGIHILSAQYKLLLPHLRAQSSRRNIDLNPERARQNSCLGCKGKRQRVRLKYVCEPYRSYTESILQEVPVLASSSLIKHEEPLLITRNRPFHRNELPRSPHSAALHPISTEHGRSKLNTHTCNHEQLCVVVSCILQMSAL